MTATCSNLVAVVGRRLRGDGRAADTGRLKVNIAPAVSVFLGVNPRPAKIFLDTGLWQVAGSVSRGRRWGWDGASLERASESQDDIMSRIGSISDSTGGLASYDYLGAGTVASVSYPQPGLSLDYSADNFAAWDRFGQVLNQGWKEGSTTVDGYSYTYSQSGNRLTRANLIDAALSESYGYDGLDRLTSVVRNGTQTEGWTLDSLGNFVQSSENGVSQSRTTDAANEIQTITQNETQNAQGYDAAGNMTTIADPNNPNGTLTCTFDAWNRLSEVRDSSGNIIAKYQYDGSGRLIEELSDFSGTTPGTVTYSFYDGQNAIETRTGAVSSGVVPTASSLSPQYQYVFSPMGGKTPILRDSTFDSETGAPTSAGRLYFTSDANTNVTALVDATGEVVERYIYSAYGVVTFCDASWAPLTTGGSNSTTTPGVSSAVGNNTLYASMVLDPRTGLCYDRARWYDACTSVFVSHDPAMADSNLYRYCGNDPTCGTDPSGERAIDLDVEENSAEGATWRDQDVTNSDGQNIFAESRKAAIDMVAVLEKMKDARFNEILSKGSVTFNGKPFPKDKTRQDYIDMVKREETSRKLGQYNGGLNALETELTAVVKENDNPDDITAVEFHGVPALGSVIITGTPVRRDPAVAALAKIAGGSSGQYVLISCFQIEHTVEKAVYTPAFWDVEDKATYQPRKGPARQLPLRPQECVIQFDPMKITKQQTSLQ
jgi:RHS repeat-associated protein